jgi:hypothetical protein
MDGRKTGGPSILLPSRARLSAEQNCPANSQGRNSSGINSSLRTTTSLQRVCGREFRNRQPAATMQPPSPASVPAYQASQTAWPYRGRRCASGGNLRNATRELAYVVMTSPGQWAEGSSWFDHRRVLHVNILCHSPFWPWASPMLVATCEAIKPKCAGRQPWTVSC